MCMLAVTSLDAVALRLIYKPAFMDDWRSQGVLPYSLFHSLLLDLTFLTGHFYSSDTMLNAGASL